MSVSRVTSARDRQEKIPWVFQESLPSSSWINPDPNGSSPSQPITRLLEGSSHKHLALHFLPLSQLFHSGLIWDGIHPKPKEKLFFVGLVGVFLGKALPDAPLEHPDPCLKFPKVQKKPRVLQEFLIHQRCQIGNELPWDLPSPHHLIPKKAQKNPK